MTKNLGISILLFLTLSSTAFAGDKSLTAIFGSSFRGNSKTVMGKAGPSRKNNGEQLVFTFRNPVTITSLKLAGVSLSKKGSVLVRYAVARSVADDATGDVSLDGLWQFYTSKGTAKDHENYVMLGDTNDVSVGLDKAYKQLVLTVEGMSDNDASLYVEMLTNEEIETKDFSITRTGSDEVLGGLVNESGYANFKGPQLAALMKASADPSADLLAGHTYACSMYALKAKSNLDYKSRMFYMDGDALDSISSTDPTVANWVWGDSGWSIPYPWQSPCGMLNGDIIIKRTPEGNTISENVIKRYDFDILCFNSKGAGQDEVEAAMNQSMFPSAIDNATYAVLSYEFCRLTN